MSLLNFYYISNAIFSTVGTIFFLTGFFLFLYLFLKIRRLLKNLDWLVIKGKETGWEIQNFVFDLISKIKKISRLFI